MYRSGGGRFRVWTRHKLASKEDRGASRRADEVEAPGDWFGADQRHSTALFHAPVRESEQAECHRSRGDPVHPIPAQQGQVRSTTEWSLAPEGKKQNT